MKHEILIDRLACTALFLLLVSVSASAADQVGLAGYIKAVHLESNSASGSAYRDYIILDTGIGEQMYYWRGSVCPGKNLRYSPMQDTMVDALSEYATFPDMCIKPFYKHGQAAGSRCLVSYTAFLKVGDECEVRERY